MPAEDLRSRLQSRWTLDGLTALVTGGTGGIGKGIVEELAALGASVYTCGRSLETLELRLSQWREAGLRVEGSVCDICCRQARIDLIQRASDHFGGKLDIVVNNVGTYSEKPFLEQSEDDFAFMMTKNVETGYHFCQLAYPLLKASVSASVVFITSISGLQPIASVPSTLYCTTKGALHQMARSLAYQWGKDQIRVNCVAPGSVITEHVAEAVMSLKGKRPEYFPKHVPLGRIGEPAEIGALVAFLCMPCASFCTGGIFVADGGSAVKGLFSD